MTNLTNDSFVQQSAEAIRAQHDGNDDEVLQVLTDMGWNQRHDLFQTLDDLMERIKQVDQHEGTPEPD